MILIGGNFCSFFSRAREDLRAANQRINSMLADYGDVVPRREFEMLETSYKVSTKVLLVYELNLFCYF